MIPYLFVAAGGAIGACLRFGLTSLMATLFGRGFPYGTLSVNLIGALSIGLTLGFIQQGVIGEHPWRPFIMVGILGGFTTFSSFSLDTLTLIERGDVGHAAFYVFASVGAALAGLIFGVHLMRWVLA